MSDAFSVSDWPPPPPRAPLSALLAAQTGCLPSFCFDFLSSAAEHRDWANLVSRKAGGSCRTVLPFAQLVRMGAEDHADVFILPYTSVPLRLPLRLSRSHHLVLGADFPLAAPDLNAAAAVLADSARGLSLVGGLLGSSRLQYRQWLGLSRYSGHVGYEMELRSTSSLSVLSPALSLLSSYLSLSSTASVVANSLQLTHASSRLHLRPFAASGDRGLLTAEVLLARGPEEESEASMRLMYTHRLSEERKEEPQQNPEADMRSRAASAAAAGSETARGVEATVESGFSWLQQSISSIFRAVRRPPPKVELPSSSLFASLSALTASLSPPPPPPFLPSLPFPSYLSLGLAYLPALSLPADGAAGARSYRLLDAPPSPLLPSLPPSIGLAVGCLAELSPSLSVQSELRASEERSSGDLQLSWQGGGSRKSQDSSRWFLSVGAVRDSKDATRSHVQASLGIAINW